MQNKVEDSLYQEHEAEDMAVGLKYAGIPSDSIFIKHDDTELLIQ